MDFLRTDGPAQLGSKTSSGALSWDDDAGSESLRVLDAAKTPPNPSQELPDRNEASPLGE